MTIAIPDLWSDDIKISVLSPIAVLKTQEGILGRKTQGLLQAKLTTTETDQLVQHALDLVAPGLNFYRERLLSATHGRTMPYPVTVNSEAFAPEPFNAMQLIGAAMERISDPSVLQRRAATDEEFIKLVREILHSEHVRALIHSLVAQINAQKQEPSQSGTAESEAGTSD